MVMDMLRQNFSGEPYLLVKERAKFLQKWTTRCKELDKTMSIKLHEGLEGHLKRRIARKTTPSFSGNAGRVGIPRQDLGRRDTCGFPPFRLANQSPMFFSGFFEKTGSES